MKEIKLPQGKIVIVDDDWFEELNKHKWHCNNSGYVVRGSYENRKPIKILMHRVVNNTPVGFDTDHINANRLDNQESNLRTVTTQQNVFNQRSFKNATSQYKGVSYFKRNHCWRAQSTRLGKVIHLGLFKNEKDAAIAYNNFVKEYHGEYARLNIVDSDT